jgi:hypothetical protein
MEIALLDAKSAAIEVRWNPNAGCSPLQDNLGDGLRRGVSD